jgi:hypothetical protein
MLARNACRVVDDKSPDDASGIVSTCSIREMVRMRCVQ